MQQCSSKKNDATKWSEQAKAIKTKKRDLAVEEHFGGDHTALDAYLDQFDDDQHGRKRAVRMGRYTKETVGGSVVETLRNWNEPIEPGQGTAVEPTPELIVDGKKIEVLAGSPSMVGRFEGLVLVDCGLAKAGSTCANAPTDKPWACLIERGEVSFAEKLDTCIAQGGKGLIMFNRVVPTPSGGDEDSLFSASLGDSGSKIPSVCTRRSVGLMLKATQLGKLATLDVPPEVAKSTFMPLTYAVDQGPCGSCYLFASIAAVRMWANLLIWEEMEAAGKTFGPANQVWIDAAQMMHCYQDMLANKSPKEEGILNVYFDGETPDGTDEQLREKLTTVLQAFAYSTTAQTMPLRGAVSSFSVRNAEKDCGFGCVQVKVSWSLYSQIVQLHPQKTTEGLLSNGFEGMLGAKKFKVTKVEGIAGSIVCGGGWHHKVIQEWYIEQQLSRVGSSASSVRFVTRDSSKAADVDAEKLAKGSSQANISKSKCTKLADKDVSPGAPLLYRFDPFFEEDEAKVNAKPTREFGPLAAYRPIYMDVKAGPGSVAFADKVRALVTAAQYGPVMIGIAVCNTMFAVSSSNSIENPYYDLACKDTINHIVIVTGFKVIDLPAEGSAGRSSKWWERSVIQVQNSWGSDWGHYGQAWVRVDFTQNWGLGIVPLLRRPGKFGNPLLPRARLEELRLPTPWARRTESITGQSLPLLELGKLVQINRPTLPEIAASEVVITLLALDASGSAVAPKFNAAKATFGILFSSQKYFANEEKPLSKAKIDLIKPAVGADTCAVATAAKKACVPKMPSDMEPLLAADACAAVNCCFKEGDEIPCYEPVAAPAVDATTIKRDGSWVFWTNQNNGKWTWSVTDVTSPSTRDAVKMYQVVIRILLTPTAETRTKPATFWSSLSLGIDFDTFPTTNIAVKDLYLKVDQEQSAEFRLAGGVPEDTDPVTASASTGVVAGVAASIAAAATML